MSIYIRRTLFSANLVAFLNSIFPETYSPLMRIYQYRRNAEHGNAAFQN